MSTKIEQIHKRIDAFNWKEQDVPEQLTDRLRGIPEEIQKNRRMEKRITYFAAASIVFLLSFNVVAWKEKEKQEKSTSISSSYFDYLNQQP